MAPDVKQGAAAWDDMLRINARVTTEMVKEIDSQERWYDRFIAEQGAYVDQLIGERRALREQVRMWKIAFLTVCVQFFVVAVAAVWGWTR